MRLPRSLDVRPSLPTTNRAFLGGTEDNFNLYGLRNEIPHFRSCLNVILDIADHSMDPKTEASLDQHVMDLYGLIHARYILTKRGMDRMVSITPTKRPMPT